MAARKRSWIQKSTEVFGLDNKSSAQKQEQVAFLGLNNLFGEISTLLLKQSPFIKCLKLYDDYNIWPAIDVSAINSNCKVKAFLGRDQLNNALKDVDIVIIGDEGNEKAGNQEALFPIVADKIISYGNAISRAAPGALVILAATPLNYLLPLLTKVLSVNGNDVKNKIFGSTAVDNICANSILANYLKIDPKFVTVPVIGGSSEATRVPILSLAKPNCNLSEDIQRDIVKNIRRRDINVYEAKGIRDSIVKAYGNVKFLSSVLAGLRGEPNIVDFAMTKTDNVNGTEYFSLPISLGRSGISKRFGIPRLNEIEEIMLSKAAIVLRKESNRAYLYLKDKYPEYSEEEPSAVKLYEKPPQPKVFGDSRKSTSINKVENNENMSLDELKLIFDDSKKATMAKGSEERENTSSNILEISWKPTHKKKYNKKSDSVSDAVVSSSYQVNSPNDQFLNVNLSSNKEQQSEYSFGRKNALYSNVKTKRLQMSKLKPSFHVSINTNANEYGKSLHNELNKDIPIKNALSTQGKSVLLSNRNFNTYQESNTKSDNSKKTIWYTDPSDNYYSKNSENMLNQLEISIDMKFPEFLATQKNFGYSLKKRNETLEKKLKEEDLMKTNQGFYKLKINESNKYSDVEKPYFCLKNNISKNLAAAISKAGSVLAPLPRSSLDLRSAGKEISYQTEAFLERFKQRNMSERETCKTEVDTYGQKAVEKQQTSEIPEPALKFYSVKPSQNKSNIVKGTFSSDVEIKRDLDRKELNRLDNIGNKIEHIHKTVNKSKEQSSTTSERASVTNNQDIKKNCNGKEGDLAQEQVDVNETETTLQQFDLQNPQLKDETLLIPDINKKQYVSAEEVERESNVQTANTETEEKLSIATAGCLSSEQQNNITLSENSCTDKTMKVENQLQQEQSMNNSQLGSNTLNSTIKTNIVNKEGSASNSSPYINPHNKSDRAHPFIQLKENNISDQQKLKKGQYNGLKRIDIMFSPNKTKTSVKAPNKRKLNKLSLLNSKLKSIENINVTEENETCDKEELLKPSEKELQDQSKLRLLNKLSLLNIPGQYEKLVVNDKINEQNTALKSSSNFTLNNPDKQYYTSNTLDQKSNEKEMNKSHKNKNNFSSTNSTLNKRSPMKTSLEISNRNDFPSKQYLKEQEKSSLADEFEQESYAQTLGTFSYADVTSLKKSVNARANNKNVKERKHVSVKTKRSSNNLSKKEETLHSPKKEITETIKGLKTTATKTKIKEAQLKPSSTNATIDAKPSHQDSLESEDILQPPSKEILEKNDALKPTTKVDKKYQSKISLLKPRTITISKRKPLGHSLLKYNLPSPGLKIFKKPPLFKNKFHLLTANKQNQAYTVKRNKPSKKLDKTEVEKVESVNSDALKTVTLDAVPASLFSKLSSYSDSVSKKNSEFLLSAEELLNDNQNLQLSPYKILIEKSSKILTNYDTGNDETNSRNNRNVPYTAAINYYKKRETPDEISLSKDTYPAPSLYQNLARKKASLKKIIEMKKTASKAGTSIQYKKPSKKSIKKGLTESSRNKKLLTDSYQFGREKGILPKTISNNESTPRKYNTILINNTLLTGDGTSPNKENLLKQHESHKINNINSPFKNLGFFKLEDSQIKVPNVQNNNFVFDNVPYSEYNKYNNFPSIQHFLK